MYPLLSTGNLNWEAMSFKPILQCWIWSFVIVKCFDRWTWTAPWKRWLDDINTATTRVVTHSVFCILGAQNALLYVIILSRKVHLGRMSSGLLFLFNTTGEKKKLSIRSIMYRYEPLFVEWLPQYPTSSSTYDRSDGSTLTLIQQYRYIHLGLNGRLISVELKKQKFFGSRLKETVTAVC